MFFIARKGANAIIRPDRRKYDIHSIPVTMEIPDFGTITRAPISFFNNRGQRLYGSLYLAPNPAKCSPCVIYLHGNSDCQLEGQTIVPLFLPVGINVFCFDFAGSGVSDGKYISLGYYEREDVDCVINLLRNNFGIKKISLWGRSMGASTAFFVLADHPDISSAIIDSPFAKLTGVVESLAEKQKIPGCVVSSAISAIYDQVYSKAHFRVTSVSPLDIIKKCYSPVFIIHGKSDDLIDPSHSLRLYEEYECPVKELHLIDADHHSQRSEEIYIAATEFITKNIGIEIEF